MVRVQLREHLLLLESRHLDPKVVTLNPPRLSYYRTKHHTNKIVKNNLQALSKTFFYTCLIECQKDPHLGNRTHVPKSLALVNL